MRRDHRGVERVVERRSRYTPHIIPAGATLLKFGRMWKVGGRVPEGYALRHLPLIRVGYTLDSMIV